MDTITATPVADNGARHKFPPMLLEQAGEHLAQVEDVLLSLVENAASVDGSRSNIRRGGCAANLPTARAILLSTPKLLFAADTIKA